MKKFVMAATAAALLTSAYADSCASSFSGFYAGLQAGVGSANGSVSGDNVYTAAAAAGPFSYRNSAGDKSFVGGLLVGYGMGVGTCAYVGGELYASYDSLNARLLNDGTSNTFSSKVQHNYNLGAKVRLGYTASQQVMLFLGLGVEYAPTKLKVTNTNTVTRTLNGATFNKTKQNFAFAPSVGMDVFLSKNLFVRGEYTYVFNGISAKVQDANATTTAAPRLAVVKAKLDQQRFMVAVGYKF